MTAPAGPSLVTGGSGFIGSHLVDALIQCGDRPVVIDTARAWQRLTELDRGDSGYARHAVDLCVDDVRGILADLQPAAIFHLFGFASVPASVSRPRHDLEMNTAATLNLLEAVRESSPASKVIFTSSAAVYGEGSGAPFRESDALSPQAPYAVSKLAAEGYMAVYAKAHRLRTASLRLFPNYGPRLRAHVVYDLMRKIRDDPREVRLDGDGRQVRDFVYVGDTVRALLRVAEAAPLGGEVYNVGTGVPVSVGRLAEVICEEMHVTPRLVYTGSVAPGVSLSWLADISRLQGLGYAPRVPLRDGIRATVAWFNTSAG